MTLRSISGLILVLALASLTVAFTNSREVQEKSPQEALDELFEKRRDILSRRVDILEAQHEAGTGNLYPLMLARDELLKAELDMAKTKKARVMVQRKRVENMTLLVDRASTRFEAGQVGEESLLIITATKLQAEIDLQRELLRD